MVVSTIGANDSSTAIFILPLVGVSLIEPFLEPHDEVIDTKIKTGDKIAKLNLCGNNIDTSVFLNFIFKL